MADLNKIVDLISECSVVEVSELVKMLEEKFGVSAAAPVMMAGPVQAAQEEAKTEFNVMLKDFGANKMGVIKAVKDLLGIGLIDAKALVEKAPVVIKEAVPTKEAEELAAKLKEAGATVDLQ